MEKVLSIIRKLVPRKIFKFFQPAYHFLLALTGNIIYRFPGRKLIVIGVTGTNGKSTTVDLVNSVLKTAGFKTGMISTVAIEINGRRKDNTTNRTTLGRWQTAKLLRQMVKAKCDYAIVEVASEGIAWFRVWGIPFDIAVFTNLSPEHLNFHKTMAHYRNTKGKLFANLSLSKKKKLKKQKIQKVSITNAEDKEFGYFSAFPADAKYSYGLKRGDATVASLKEGEGMSFDITYRGKTYPQKTELSAKFNVYNILAAWCVGMSQNIDPKVIAKGISAVKLVRGRMEKVTEKNGVKYYIDYAVTPDSFELLFKEMRKLTKGKLIAVFGATGDRDKSKRPLLGEMAAKYADIAIITDEEPYSEDPAKIIEEVAAGAEKIAKDKVIKIADRKQALIKATEIAKAGDIVVATGMGHQKYRNVGGNKKIEWDEASQIRNILK